MAIRYFKCKNCGNLVSMVRDAGVPLMCCGQKMEEILPGVTDAAVEKHVPEVKVQGNHVMVQVGSVKHPMATEHYIEWVSLETKEGEQRKALHPDMEPEVIFTLSESDEPIAVYAYCNLHGLWKADVKKEN